MCGADSARGFDTTHPWHVNIHQHDPGTAGSKEFDRGFTSPAFAGHDEIVHDGQGGGCSHAETGLIVDNPYSHPLVRHLGIVPGRCGAHHGVHTTVSVVCTHQTLKPASGRRGTSAQP